MKVTSETVTTISATNTYYDLLGTWTTDDLQHFDSPSNGQLRHLGNSPREFSIVGSLILDGTTADNLRLKVQKWDDSASSFSEVYSQVREVNALVGARDVAFFTILTNVILDQNDYIFLQVQNETTTGNATVEIDSFLRVGER